MALGWTESSSISCTWWYELNESICEKLIAENISSCSSIKNQNPAAVDWTYTIDPENNWTWFEAYCDMTTDWGGWTRYADIKWNYNDTDALSCWKWNHVNNSTIECFNPNRLWMKATKLMVKIWWNNYYIPLNWLADYQAQTNAWSYYCKWNSEYMTIMDSWTYPWDEASSFTRVRLWWSYCKYERQVWWKGWWNSYMNFSSGWSWWPTPWARETNVIAWEFYVR